MDICISVKSKYISLSEHQTQYFTSENIIAVTSENIIADVHTQVKYNLTLHLRKTNFLYI